MHEDVLDVFLSHSSAAGAVVEEIARQLSDASLRPRFSPWQERGGDDWQSDLASSKHSDRSLRVISVLLAGESQTAKDNMPLFLRIDTWIEFTEAPALSCNTTLWVRSDGRFRQVGKSLSFWWPGSEFQFLHDVAVISTGNLLVVKMKGYLILFDLNAEHWVERARKIPNREITEAEWNFLTGGDRIGYDE